MGNFFTSPRERAASSMYDMAVSGKTPYDSLLGDIYKRGQTNIEQTAGRASAGVGGDILSTLASMGIAPGAGAIDAINKSKVGIAAGASEATGKLGASEMETRVGALQSLLQLGINGLSATTPAGDLLGGLTALANIGAGVAGMGGSSGLNWWGGVGKKGGGPNYPSSYYDKAFKTN